MPLSYLLLFGCVDDELDVLLELLLELGVDEKLPIILDQAFW